MKVLIVYNTSEYLLRFRTELIQSMLISGCEVIAITPRDASTPALKDLGVTWKEWTIHGQSMNFIKDIRSIVQLYKLIKSDIPDAVLNFTIKPVIYSSLVCHFLKVPCIVSMITGLGSVFVPGGIRKSVMLALLFPIYRFAMRKNSFVLFQNNDDLDLFVSKLFVNKDRAVRINGSGVNLAQFSPKQNSVVQGSFLLISRMIREKGIYEFVAAARIVKLRYPDAKFVIVGPIDSNPGAISIDEIRTWENENVISYEGPQSDVRPYLSKAEIYVLPSYYYEGVPRSILEALAMSKPVITTDWRGCRDTVDHNVNGFLVKIKDVESLAAAMLKFLDDPSLSKAFSVASRQKAELTYDVNIINSFVMRSLGIEAPKSTESRLI